MIPALDRPDNALGGLIIAAMYVVSAAALIVVVITVILAEHVRARLAARRAR